MTMASLGKDTNCKDIYVYVNAHQRRFTAEEALNNQVGQNDALCGCQTIPLPDTNTCSMGP